MNEVALVAAIIALGTLSVASVGGCIYFAKYALVTKDGAVADRVNAATAAIKVAQANDENTRLVADNKALNARVALLEKGASDADTVAAGTGDDELRRRVDADPASAADRPGP